MSHDSRASELPSAALAQNAQAQAELDLVQAVLSSPSACYPWNPASTQAEASFLEMEQSFSWEGWSADEISSRANALMNNMDRLWTHQTLLSRFSVQVPQSLLATLIERAQQAVASQLSLMDRLVYCVQSLLPEWGEDDLQVLARPLACAMRGAEQEEIAAVLTNVQQAQWSDLSEVEQARLGLAIAHYALDELEQSPRE